MRIHVLARAAASCCAATAAALLLAAGSARSALAQQEATVTFAGRVVDRSGGHPVPGARVELARAQRVAVTDSAGAFRIEEIAPGNDFLVARAAGYVAAQGEVPLSPGLPEVTIELLALGDSAADAVAEASFSGRVVDAASGQPVAGARVEMLTGGHRTASDAQGHFLLSGLPVGSNMLRVRLTGYQTVAAVVELTPDLPLVEVPLSPDPVLLEGLQVVADRFERRRRATSMSSRVIEGQALAASGGATADMVIKRDLGITMVPCPDSTDRCILRRGHRSMPRVYVDEVLQVDGLEALEFYDASEVERIEVYARGLLVHVYTVGFMEAAARRRIRPQPITF